MNFGRKERRTNKMRKNETDEKRMAVRERERERAGE